jgi:hypothetical protein
MTRPRCGASQIAQVSLAAHEFIRRRGSLEPSEIVDMPAAVTAVGAGGVAPASIEIALGGSLHSCSCHRPAAKPRVPTLRSEQALRCMGPLARQPAPIHVNREAL